MAPRRRAGRNPSGVNRRMLTQRQKLTAQRLPTFQGPSPAPQQGPSLRIPQGLMGTRPPAPPAAARPAPGPDIFNPSAYQGGRPPMPKGSGNPLGFLQSALSLLGGPASTAMMVMNPRPTADGTLKAALKRGDYKPMQGPPKPKAPMKRNLSAAAKDFDRTFAQARAEGLTEFTWRGRRYNTRYAGE